MDDRARTHRNVSPSLYHGMSSTHGASQGLRPSLPAPSLPKPQESTIPASHTRNEEGTLAERARGAIDPPRQKKGGYNNATASKRWRDGQKKNNREGFLRKETERRQKYRKRGGKSQARPSADAHENEASQLKNATANALHEPPSRKRHNSHHHSHPPGFATQNPSAFRIDHSYAPSITAQNISNHPSKPKSGAAVYDKGIDSMMGCFSQDTQYTAPPEIERKSQHVTGTSIERSNRLDSGLQFAAATNEEGVTKRSMTAEKIRAREEKNPKNRERRSRAGKSQARPSANALEKEASHRKTATTNAPHEPPSRKQHSSPLPSFQLAFGTSNQSTSRTKSHHTTQVTDRESRGSVAPPSRRLCYEFEEPDVGPDPSVEGLIEFESERNNRLKKQRKKQYQKALEQESALPWLTKEEQVWRHFGNPA